MKIDRVVERDSHDHSIGFKLQVQSSKFKTWNLKPENFETSFLSPTTIGHRPDRMVQRQCLTLSLAPCVIDLTR